MIAAPVRMVPKACTILLVEDDASLRLSLAEFLKDHGYRPYAVGTLREASETLRATSPAVCLLDLNLPDGSGLELLRHIIEKKLPTRVIVMTAFPLQHLRPHDPAGNLTAWFTKPVAPGALLEAVEKAIHFEDDAGTR